jgi:hypothetical protein
MAAKTSISELRPALQNPAVQHCLQAYKRVYRKQLKLTTSKVLARYHANEAFKSAMPILVGDKNIRDFIACVAFGMETGAIQEDTATRFFNAAAIALRATRHNKKSQNTKSTKPAPKNPVKPNNSKHLSTKSRCFSRPVENDVKI